MEFDYVWLLALPVFFALGWAAARVDIRQVVSESRSVPRTYFQGLNFLLNEQPDKAIEAFLTVARGDQETVELHFALGSLFRRRGETERAIRMHQSLLEREDLGEEDRLHALAELGHDFLKAGLLDRAEAVFQKLRGTVREEEALTSLLEIYEQEKDWAKAIEVASALPDTSSHRWQDDIAQFHCELAASALLHAELNEAERHVKAALAVDRRHVRATLLGGDVAKAQGDIDEAIRAWKRVEQQDPGYLSLVARRLLEACRSKGQATEGRLLLKGYLAAYPSLDLLEVIYDAVVAEEGPEAAYVLVRDELRRNPTLLGLEKLVQAQSMLSPPERQGDLDLVRSLVHNHTRRVARYRCDNCGFKARNYYWRCPGCGAWESYPPKRSEEYELTP